LQGFDAARARPVEARRVVLESSGSSGGNPALIRGQYSQFVDAELAKFRIITILECQS